MISLAPFKYRSILARDGGPVQSLVCSGTTLWDGSPCFSAAATLAASLRPGSPRALGIYDDADGGGTSRSRNSATFIAVSEALERWAYYASSSGPSRAVLGFEVDDSTTGMAAFPGLTPRGARTNAALEAAERWSVLEWWRGTLGARTFPYRMPAADACEISTPFPDTSVVVVWRRSPEFAGVAYGFAAGRSRERACERAGIELTRNLNALGRFYARTGRTPASVDLADVRDSLERRLVYFSTAPGFAAFQARLSTSQGVSSVRARPETAVDCEVQGPWSKFARVWRILYRHEQGGDDGRNVDVFAF